MDDFEEYTVYRMLDEYGWDGSLSFHSNPDEDFRTHLAIDIETYSSMDLAESGVYAYTEAPDFEILLIGYAWDDEPVQIVDLADGEPMPEDLLEALTDPSITKSAFNANFERTCLARHFNRPMPPEQWACSKVHAATLGLPGSLEGVAQALGLEQQKDAAGKALIRFFSVPCRPTKRNGGRTRNLPRHDRIRWELFKRYCKQDVEVERAIRKRLEKYPVPETERRLWFIDQKINDRGVRVELGLAKNAVECDSRYQSRLVDEARALTGLENPNSLSQLKDWLAAKGLQVDSLGKDDLPELMEAAGDETVRRVLEIRKELGKTSVKKYEAMLRAVCKDRRIRGLLAFYGANRTGRWSGRLVQIQNLPRNSMKDLDLARQLLLEGEHEALEMLYESVPEVLSQLIRTSFVPEPGHRFLVADFSAIEARCVAWLAGEEWVLEAFRTHGKIYEATAAQMFGVPMEKIVKGNPEYELRQKGKIATLACIAEGQLVLTDRGLVPIEQVQRTDKVWDGVEFVPHQGVICQGVKEVITYDGLTATPDHLVWVEGQSEPVRFEHAAASGSRLLRAAVGGKAIRVGENHQSGEALYEGMAQTHGVNSMHRLRDDSMDELREPNAREIERLSVMLPTKKHSPVAGPEANGSKATVRKPERPSIQELWRSRNSVQVPISPRSGALDNRTLRSAVTGYGDRSHQQQRTLRAWKSPVGDTRNAVRKPEAYEIRKVGPSAVALRQECSGKEAGTRDVSGGNYRGRETSGAGKTEELEVHRQKVRVYDLMNAGPRNRYTVSGCLVHNCGYGGGTGALEAMGALRMGLRPEELPGIILRWREANPKIVQFWSDTEKAAVTAVLRKREVGLRNLTFSFEDGTLFIRLPSGRRLAYVNARVERDGQGRAVLTYEGYETGKWTRLRTYGGRLVENCLAGDTKVLTQRGWVPICEVRTTDVLWDGVEWVKHDGVVDKGVQRTIRLDGVGLTPDHLVLTEEGWRNAASCEGHHKAEVAYRFEPGNGNPFICEAGREEPVFDIVNAGPRNRFAVRGRNGPFIVHNCTQAVARDCLAEAILRLDGAGYPIVFHVHDEIVAEMPDGKGSVEEMVEIMSRPIAWAPGLPLAADGYECRYYKKD